MESVLENVERGNEDATYASLLSFNDQNKTNFTLRDDVQVREKFCSVLLDQLSSRRWLPRTQSAALTSLRIVAREKEGVAKLRSEEGLGVLIALADLSRDIKESCFHDSNERPPREQVEVLVEAVKCLCNLTLSHHSLTTLTSQLGVLHGLRLRLKLVRNVDIPSDVLTFDLRLLFLMTACGVEERVQFREEYNGLYILVNLIDFIIFGHDETTPSLDDGGQEVVSTVTETPGAIAVDTTEEAAENSIPTEQLGSPELRGSCESPLKLPPKRGSVVLLPRPLSLEQLGWVAEAMKVVFNQTVHWKEEGEFTEDEVALLMRVVVLIRILLVSVPYQLGKPAMDAVIHSVEVLVNTPFECSEKLLLPAEVQLMPTLKSRHPVLFPDSHSGASGGASVCVSLSEEWRYDEIWDGKYMTCVSCLMQLLVHALESQSSSLSTLLTVLRNISKGSRDIRRFLKSKILPPLGEVTQRPEQETTLKGRLVRLMTASEGGSSGSEAVAAELLFVLCKEDSSRLIKYTGYGNAAGLLLTHGLLGGGKSEGASNYSSDSDSDTEDYVESKPRIDPVTAGPSVEEREGEREPMTDEEKEREAERLVEMMRQLNEQGVIRVLPMEGQSQDTFP